MRDICDRLLESLDLALEECDRARLDEDGLRPWSAPKLRELVGRVRAAVDTARQDALDVALLTNDGKETPIAG